MSFSTKKSLVAVCASVLGLTLTTASAAPAQTDTDCGLWNRQNPNVHVRACSDIRNTARGWQFRSFLRADMRIPRASSVGGCAIYMLATAGNSTLQNGRRTCTYQATYVENARTGTWEYFRESSWKYFAGATGCKVVKGRLDLRYQGRVQRSGTAIYPWGC